MARYGLLGEHLGHSYSPRMHKLLGGYDYELFEVAPDALAAFLQSADWDGLNVTIPYKKSVVPFCGALTDRARAIGSVNTLTRLPDGSLLGDNTDYAGFSWLLSHSGAQVRGRKALVLGDGGAAATVRAVLREAGAAPIVTISRRGEDNYETLDRHADAFLIVNTTPLGMYPQNGAAAVDLKRFPACRCVLDLIYNPARTQLMLQADALGIPAFGGLGMLVEQARAAAERFLGEPIADARMRAVLDQLERESRNVALIGMPGCGKTTTGRALAARTGRRFVDLDELLAAHLGRSAGDYLRLHGEAAIRREETAALRETSKQSGLVLATGGGVVTRPENLPLLQQNSRIVYLRRPLADLPAEGRPLSLARGVEALAREREPLYESWSELTISAGSPEEAARQIQEAYGL